MISQIYKRMSCFIHLQAILLTVIVNAGQVDISEIFEWTWDSENVSFSVSRIN